MSEDKHRPDHLALPSMECREHPSLLDPWIAASVLQKAIRRSEAEAAVRAAFAYARSRGNGVWRRLLVVAFEDVSVGAPEVVVETADLCASALSRTGRRIEPDRLEALVRRFADAPKDRAPDHLLTTAMFSPGLGQARRLAASRSQEDHLAAVSDTSISVVEKATASTLAAGLDQHGSLRGGDLAVEALFRIFGDLGVPADLVAATRTAAVLTREPITIMTPLLWLEVEKAGSRSFIKQTISASPLLGGVPAYALDKHTAVGKAAIARFALQNQAVRQALSTQARADRANKAASMAVFHTEGSATAWRHFWEGAHRLERLGVEADMLKAGALPDGAGAILAAVRENLDHLHAVRAELFLSPKRRSSPPLPFPTSAK